MLVCVGWWWLVGAAHARAVAGLNVRRRSEALVRTTPAEFHRLFPATGGALYGHTGMYPMDIVMKPN